MKRSKLCRTKCKSRDEWIACRYNGIGASESAAVVGLSPWLTSSELWQIKTGMKQPADLSGNEAVSTGNRMEPILRNLFKAMHPQMKLTYHQYDLLSQKDRPWLFATLDGELKDGKKNGILEIKTATPTGASGWADWKDQIPEHYMVQICHQLLATGYDFVILYACLFTRDNDFTVREYRFNREDCQQDMDWLLEKETEFWNKIQKNEVPGLTILL